MWLLNLLDLLSITCVRRAAVANSCESLALFFSVLMLEWSDSCMALFQETVQ